MTLVVIVCELDGINRPLSTLLACYLILTTIETTPVANTQNVVATVYLF